MLLQEVAAQTTSYMIAGFAVILGLIGLLIISLFVRTRRLRRELEMLESLHEEQALS